VKSTLVHSTFTKESNRNPIFTAHFARERSTNSRPHTLANNTRAGKIYVSIKDMHVATTTTTKSGFFTENFCCHFIKVNALGDRLVVRAVRGCNNIARRKVSNYTNSTRLLTIGEVHLPRDRTLSHIENWRLAFHVNAFHRLFKKATDHHGLMHP
jgi:hypothetical protein